MAQGSAPCMMLGALAGAAGGAVGGWAKLRAEAAYPPRPDGRLAPPAILLKQLAERQGRPEPSQESLDSGTMAMHWGMSVVFGAIYGALAEPVPLIRVGGGVGYGLAVWIGAHETAIPKLALSPPRTELSPQEHMSEALSHSAFGLALEATRAALRCTVLRGGPDVA